jgi:chemotaxis family two-component system response regulator Rcp1
MRLPAGAQELGRIEMTRRPRTVSGAAGPGRIGVPLVPTVLLADADADARAMLRDALLEGTGPCDLRTVATVRELEQYLETGDDVTTPPPSIILIDLDLPDTSTGALDAVRAIKCNPALRRIPVVVLARHPERDQVDAAYDAGANTLIAKPVTFLALVKLIKVFTAYWLEAAALPQNPE